MKIRDGFVTNSSSTNFLIISKEELTNEYLLKKLGFKPNSLIFDAGEKLIDSIISGIEHSLRWRDYNCENPTYNEILKLFGEKSAEKFRKLKEKGYKVYIGSTSSDEGFMTTFMTCDFFLIDDKDFYMDGRECVW